MDALAGKHVVVTGGGRGIGRAIAERLAAEGASLSLLAPNLDELEEVAARVGGDAHFCDIRDRAGVDAAFAAAASARGPIHALVANSGDRRRERRRSRRPLRGDRADESLRRLLVHPRRGPASRAGARTPATSS